MKAIRCSAIVLAVATVALAVSARRPTASVPTGHDDGVVPAGVTVFDDRWPGVARLRADLRRALSAATTDAAGDGVTIGVNSGWRSPAYQRRLLADAVDRYGSAEAAARWVAPVRASAHVTGDAVDVGPADAAAWLSTRGTRYGLCQIYANEPWHYELRPGAARDGCPTMYADASLDPKLRP